MSQHSDVMKMWKENLVNPGKGLNSQQFSNCEKNLPKSKSISYLMGTWVLISKGFRRPGVKSKICTPLIISPLCMGFVELFGPGAKALISLKIN